MIYQQEYRETKTIKSVQKKIDHIIKRNKKTNKQGLQEIPFDQYKVLTEEEKNETREYDRDQYQNNVRAIQTKI